MPQQTKQWAEDRPLVSIKPGHPSPRSSGCPHQGQAQDCHVALQQLSSERLAASRATLLGGIILSVCHLSKLFFCLLIIFRHKKKNLAPKLKFNVMKIHIHLEQAISDKRYLFDQTPLCPGLDPLPATKQAQSKVLETIVQGPSVPGTHSNHKKRQIKN